MSKFQDILALRGRIVLLTENAVVGLRFEQAAERKMFPVIHTRGWADPYGPLLYWNRIHAAREYGLLSCDQRRYLTGFAITGTDVVWVGPKGDANREPSLLVRHNLAMKLGGEFCRYWTLDESDL